jgi:hypothetical protein
MDWAAAKPRQASAAGTAKYGLLIWFT